MSYANIDAIFNKAVSETLGKIDGDVSLDRLFSREFIKKHSSFSTIRELLSLANVHNQISFENWLPTADDFISSHTDFSSWSEMLSAATNEYANRKLKALRDGNFVEETFDSPDDFSNIHVSFVHKEG